MSQKTIAVIVKIFFSIYLLTTFLLILVLFVRPNILFLLAFLFFALITWGLHQKASWIIPLLILLAAGNIVKSILTLAFDSVSLMIFCLAIFQAFFFAQKSVQKYFGANGIFLF